MGGLGSSPGSTDGEGAPYIQRDTDKPGGSSREQPGWTGPHNQRNRCQSAMPRGNGRVWGGEGSPEGQGNAAGTGSKQGMFPTSMMAPKQHMPCLTLLCAYTAQLRATRARTAECPGQGSPRPCPPWVVLVFCNLYASFRTRWTVGSCLLLKGRTELRGRGTDRRGGEIG